MLVSACLVGDKCRYNGEACTNSDLVITYQKGDVIKCCPEVLGGLKTPRNPAEIIGGDGFDVLDGKAAVVDRAGNDVTAAFIAGAQLTLNLCQKHSIKKAILKAKSPSCGEKHIYDGSFSGTFKPGVGVTAALLKKHGIIVIGV